MSKSRDGFQAVRHHSEPFHDDDEEAQLDFMGPKGSMRDGGSPVHRVVKEVKRNWWLWGAVCFALVLITGVVMFRHKLYSTGNFGLPLLAVKENAAEICASKCRLEDLGSSAGDVKSKQEYDACYSKCVAQETKEVAEEREKFKKEEEELEKQVEASSGQSVTATSGTAAKIDSSAKAGDSASSLGTANDVLDVEGITDR